MSARRDRPTGRTGTCPDCGRTDLRLLRAARTADPALARRPYAIPPHRFEGERCTGSGLRLATHETTTTNQSNEE